MKKGILKTITIFTIVCMTGCGNVMDSTVIDNATTSNTPLPTIDGSGLFQELESNDVHYRDVLSLEDGISYDALCENLEKTESVGLEGYNAINRKLSFIPEDNQDALFCIDEASGTVYFVNQNQDWFIYRLLDDDVELAVAFPAKELYMWEGTLYFMAKDYGVYDLGDINNGDIFAYTPAKGSVELVYAAGANSEYEGYEILGDSLQKMTVSEDGIHFIGDIKMKIIEWEGMKFQSAEKTAYTLAFGTKEPVIDNRDKTNLGWHEYIFINSMAENDAELAMQLRENSETIIELQLPVPSIYGVIEENLYGLYSQSIVEFNLKTREKRIYDFNEVISNTYQEDILRMKAFYIQQNADKEGAEDDEISMDLPTLVTFTKVGNTLWTVDYYGRIYSIDMETDEATAFQIGDNFPFTLQEMAETSNFNKKLYTDGDNLYIWDGSNISKVLLEKRNEAKEMSVYILETVPLVKK